LDGQLLLFKVKEEMAATDSGMEWEQMWGYNLRSPIFAAPIHVIAVSTREEERRAVEAIVSVSVNGHMMAVSLDGRALWESSIGDTTGVYITPIVLSNRKKALVATKGGHVHLVDCHAGEVKHRWRSYSLMAELPGHISALVGVSSDHNNAAATRFVVATTAGCIALYTIRDDHIIIDNHRSSLELTPGETAMLPAGVFSLAPGPTHATIVAGCRDDCIYLLSIS